MPRTGVGIQSGPIWLEGPVQTSLQPGPGDFTHSVEVLTV